MRSCDIIIPVYKSPEWVKLCVYSLFINTNLDIINKVYLINDCDDELTANCLENLKNKYCKIEILKNEKNLGFVKSVNRGLKKTTADYVLLLNTDCMISHNSIQKMINHCKKDKEIGLICPISSNAANLTFDMFEGFSFNDMNSLFEKKFLGKCFDACTVVGNCLMITRDCIRQVGYLDEIYGMGYGEETDYQFKSMTKGFKAKVAIDTYVFHKSEVSFGTSKEKQEKQQKNAKIFFDRWGEQYYKLLEKYKKNDPIEYIKSHLKESDKKVNYNFLVYIIGFSQTAGGIHMTTDMINYLSINNYPCNIMYQYDNSSEYKEIMLFNPISVEKIDKLTFKYLVATFNTTVFYMKNLSRKYNVPLIYFAQGYENYFYNGKEYGISELSYKLPDDILTISKYLKDKYKKSFNVDSSVVLNGINYDLLSREKSINETNTITFMLRNDTLKGDFILLDIIKQLINECDNININILYNSEKLYFPKNSNETIKINYLKGPFTRTEIANTLQKSDIFVDASLTEGFGLMSLEAMTAGNVVVVGDSGGINEYLINEKNGVIIKNVLDVDLYVKNIKRLLGDKKMYNSMLIEAKKTAKKYDYDNVCKEYIKYFSREISIKNTKMDKYDSSLYGEVLDLKFRVIEENLSEVPKKHSFSKKCLYKLSKVVPKRLKKKAKNLIIKLNDMIDN